MPSSKPILRFQDIIDNIDRIREYSAGHNKETFEDTTIVVDACERCLARVSEAAMKLGDYAEAVAPNEPWKDIRDWGSFARHAYDDVLAADVWDIIEYHLPGLYEASHAAIGAIQEHEQAVSAAPDTPSIDHEPE